MTTLGEPVVTPDPRPSSRFDRLRAVFADLGPAGALPVLLLVGLAGVQQFDLVAFGILSPDIRDTFHMSSGGIDAVASLTGALPVVLAVFLGYFGDKGNRVRLSGYAGVIWGVTAIFTGLAPVLAVLIVARIIGGVGNLTTETIYPSLLSDYYPPRVLGRMFGIFRFGTNGLAVAAGPLAGVIGAIMGWRAAFVVLAIPTFALVAWVLVGLREPGRGESQGLSFPDEQLPSLMEGYRRVRSIRTARRTWMAAFLFGGGTVPFATLLNTFFKDVYHYGDAARGEISILYGVGGLVGIILGGVLTQRAVSAGKPSRLPVVNGAMIVEFALGTAIMVLAPNAAIAIIATAILTIGVIGFLPAYTTLVSLVAPPRLRAQTYAWTLLWYALGAIFIQAIVIGPLINAHGQKVGLMVLAAIVGVGGIIGSTTKNFIDRDIEQANRLEAASRSNALLSVSGLDVGYSGVQILFGVDFEIERGDMVALLGTNGAGKSTFLKAISGLLDPTGGAIFFNGRDITHADANQTAKLGIMQVPGGRGIFPSLSVADNLKVAGWMYRKNRGYVRKALDEVIEYFPILRTRWGTLAGDLSGGEQQMLSLAQAFIAQPELLLIDELSLGLAPAVVNRLLEIVRQIHASGTTVILVEQSVNTALELAERAIFMEKGEVRFSGPTAELLERPDILRAVFLQGAAVGQQVAEEGPATNGKAAVARAAREAERHAASLLGREVVLETRGLTKRYGGVTAVDDVSLELHQGEILGLIGPNGAGKTTLFDLISGFTSINGGRVILHGEDVTELGSWQRAIKGMGRSFQDARLWPTLTVAESLAVALHDEAEIRATFPALLGIPRVADSEHHLALKVDELVDLMGLEAFRNKFVAELSTGSRRIVELGCMLAHRPSVLLLDEPSSGIAQRETEALGPLLRRIREQLDCSILIIEHDIPLINGLADHMYALDLGRVIAHGRPGEVLEDPRVVSSYLGTAGKLHLGEEEIDLREQAGPDGAQAEGAEGEDADTEGAEPVGAGARARSTGSSRTRKAAPARSGGSTRSGNGRTTRGTGTTSRTTRTTRTSRTTRSNRSTGDAGDPGEGSPE